MKQTKMIWIAMGFASIALGSTAVAQESADVESEVRRVRKELMQVQDERARVKEDIVKDKKDFEEYRKRTLARMRAVRSETDSVRQLTIVHKGGVDSLDALLNAENSRESHFQMRQDQLRSAIRKVTVDFAQTALEFPPGVSDRFTGALTLLRDELDAKTLDNIEAINRLFQIVRDMHDQGGTIQIVQGASPIPEIRGTTYRIRLGAFFEAVVNTQGTQAALWTGSDKAGVPRWEMVNDPVVSQNILKAVNVREGKALPALVTLPLGAAQTAKGE